MRLDHLLSKEEEVEGVSLLSYHGASVQTSPEEEPGACSRKTPEADGCMRAVALARISEAESSEEAGRRSRREVTEISGGDTLRGHTRSHPEHDG